MKSAIFILGLIAVAIAAPTAEIGPNSTILRSESNLDGSTYNYRYVYMFYSIQTNQIVSKRNITAMRPATESNVKSEVNNVKSLANGAPWAEVLIHS